MTILPRPSAPWRNAATHTNACQTYCGDAAAKKPAARQRVLWITPA